MGKSKKDEFERLMEKLRDRLDAVAYDAEIDARDDISLWWDLYEDFTIDAVEAICEHFVGHGYSNALPEEENEEFDRCTEIVGKILDEHGLWLAMPILKVEYEINTEAVKKIYDALKSRFK
jgi:hypothetical protein